MRQQARLSLEQGVVVYFAVVDGLESVTETPAKSFMQAGAGRRRISSLVGTNFEGLIEALMAFSLFLGWTFSSVR